MRALLVLAAILTLALLPAAPALAGDGIYVVRPDDSLSVIAQRQGVSMQALLDANGLANADLVRLGQKLIIPGVAAPAAATSSTRSYTVLPGDSLTAIAREHGASLSALMRTNGISDPNHIVIGQRLTIPGASDGPSAPGALADQTRHTVRMGDTLSSIAVQYGITVAALAGANGITSLDLLRLGRELVIPQPQGLIADFQGQPSRFVVSITQQRCWLYAGEQVVADWSCSTGQAGAGSNPGAYVIQSKIERAFGSTWNIWMPYWLGIYWAGGSENGIHGIPYDVQSGWRLWEGYVGTPVTFGCVLLDDANAAALYDLAYIGMPVIIQP